MVWKAGRERGNITVSETETQFCNIFKLHFIFQTTIEVITNYITSKGFVLVNHHQIIHMPAKVKNELCSLPVNIGIEPFINAPFVGFREFKEVS